MGREAQTRLQIGSFTACVVVDDEELPLYGIEVQGDKATCWLPSVAGKEFTVRWRDSVALHTTSSRLVVDGILCGTTVGFPRPKDSWISRNYRRESRNTVRTLSFAKIQTTDDDAYLGQSIPENFGTIELDIWEAKYLGTSAVKPSQAGSRGLGFEKLHERSKKALGHQVKFGNPIQQRDKRNNSVTEKIRRLASMTFRYRPEAFLQANGITPRPHVSGTQGPPNEDTVIDSTTDLDDDGKDKAVDQKIQALEEQLLRLRQEKQNQPNKRIKKEIKQEPKLT